MAESLRDTIAAAVENAETGGVDNAVIPAETVAQDSAATIPAAPTAAERARDDAGRFTEKPKEPAASASAKATTAKAPLPPAQAAPPLAAEPAKPRYQRPSTWRKETWGVWDKLNAGQQLTPEEIHLMAEEAIKRDSDFASGVSTYKREWDNAKPVLEAMAPFMPLLQQHKIEPGTWIGNLGRAHQMLALGTPEQKASMFVRLAGEYGVPIESLFVQGQDGKLYLNQQLQQQPTQQQQPQGLRPEDVQKLVDERLTAQTTTANIQAFAADKEKHPHFEVVRDTMAALLQAGLADGLEDAYEAALRHPRHAQLYESIQQQNRQAEEARAAEDRRKATEAARRKAVSPRSATPTSVATAGDGKKGLRSTIESAVDSVVGGRV
jgi:hypothetical protein